VALVFAVWSSLNSFTGAAKKYQGKRRAIRANKDRYASAQVSQDHLDLANAAIAC
jgi:hypothetical protein